MAECDHCGTSFDEEEAYLRHLRDAHSGDLSRIEQRRVEELETESEGVPTVAVYGATVVGILLAVALAYVFLAGGDAGDESVKTEPHSSGSVHEHGTMNVTIDGQTLDFSRDEFQMQDRQYFHYEGGSGERWHVHGEQVTLEYALSTLGIHVSENSLTYDGTTYDGDDEDTTVTFEVNGESVNPRDYVLQDGDHVRVIVTTE
jgi:hypothetical protein